MEPLLGSIFIKEAHVSGILKSVCIKSKQDNLMHSIGQADLIKTGIPNDIHCDGGDFQVTILPKEVIDEYIKKENKDFKFGDFSENLVIEGIDYKSLKPGDSLSLGDSRLLITGIGASNTKPGAGECNNEIHKNYIFCRVLVPGIITVGDQVNID